MARKIVIENSEVGIFTSANGVVNHSMAEVIAEGAVENESIRARRIALSNCKVNMKEWLRLFFPMGRITPLIS